MSAQLWIYTGAAFFMGGFILWVVITEIRLWNYAKAILYLEGRARMQAEQSNMVQRQIYDLGQSPARKTKKGKRKR